VISLVLTVMLGWCFQTATRAIELHRNQPQGRFIAIGPDVLHLDCRGTGTPTILLESGAMAVASTWALVRQELLNSYRVCAYDRPGLGWSTSGRPTGCAPTKVASELERALQLAGEVGPVVLVGHSLGGLYAWRYAQLFPTRMQGIVLLDPIDPAMIDQIPDARRELEATVRRLRWGSWLVRFGVVRLLGQGVLPPNGWPEGVRREAVMFANSPQHLIASACELEHLADLAAAPFDRTKVSGLPLLVVSVGRWSWKDSVDADFSQRRFTEMQGDIARNSSMGRRVVIEDASHLTLILSTERAKAVASLIDEFAKSASAQRPMSGRHHP
jgi:pimeloyl-ACP methyl ester carboxylesterase